MNIKSKLEKFQLTTKEVQEMLDFLSTVKRYLVALLTINPNRKSTIAMTPVGFCYFLNMFYRNDLYTKTRVESFLLETSLEYKEAQNIVPTSESWWFDLNKEGVIHRVQFITEIQKFFCDRFIL